MTASPYPNQLPGPRVSLLPSLETQTLPTQMAAAAAVAASQSLVRLLDYLSPLALYTMFGLSPVLLTAEALGLIATPGLPLSRTLHHPHQPRDSG